MINSIKLNNLRNGEYSQFLTDILAITGQNGPTVLNVQPQFDALKAVSAEIELLFKVPAGNIITKELEELDARRDSAITGINALVSGFAYSTDPATRNNAALLANHLSSFGSNIAKDNFQSETATIRNLIHDWDNKPNLTSAFAALGLFTWRVELEDANNNFSQQYLTRATEMGSASPDSISNLRLDANEAFYQLRDHLNAYFTINNGADPFGKTVSAINGLLDNYNNLIARRVTNPDPVPAPVTVA